MGWGKSFCFSGTGRTFCTCVDFHFPGCQLLTSFEIGEAFSISIYQIYWKINYVSSTITGKKFSCLYIFLFDFFYFRLSQFQLHDQLNLKSTVLLIVILSIKFCIQFLWIIEKRKTEKIFLSLFNNLKRKLFFSWGLICV